MDTLNGVSAPSAPALEKRQDENASTANNIEAGVTGASADMSADEVKAGVPPTEHSNDSSAAEPTEDKVAEQQPNPPANVEAPSSGDAAQPESVAPPVPSETPPTGDVATVTPAANTDDTAAVPSEPRAASPPSADPPSEPPAPTPAATAATPNEPAGAPPVQVSDAAPPAPPAETPAQEAAATTTTQEAAATTTTQEAAATPAPESAATTTTQEAAASTTQPTPAPPAKPVLRPSLRGKLSFDEKGVAVWEGKWGMDDSAFEPGGYISPFRYQWVKDAVVKPVVPSTDGEEANPEPAVEQKLPLGLKNCYFSGHFVMGSTKPGGAPQKITENNLFFEFVTKEAVQSEEDSNNNEDNAKGGILLVKGSGRNKFGNFVLEGELDVESRDLSVHRTYVVIPKAPKRKKTRASAPKSVAKAPAAPRAPGVMAVPRGLDPNSMILGGTRRPERMRRVPSHLTEDQNGPLAKISHLVSTMMQHDKEQYFCIPVDPVALNIPHYVTIVKSPMDLGTIANNLKEKKYDMEEQVVGHVRLTYENAMKFNPPSHAVAKMAKQYLDLFERQYKKLVKDRQREEQKLLAKKQVKKPTKPAKQDVVMSKPKTMPKSSLSSAGKKRKKHSKKKKKKKKSKKKSRHSDSDDSDDMDTDDSDEDSDDSDDSDDSSSDEEVSKSKKRKTSKKKKHKKENAEIQALKEQLEGLKSELMRQKGGSGGGRGSSQSSKPVQRRKNDRPLAYQEKRQLVQDIHKLSHGNIEKVISIIRENGGPLGGEGDEVELDIDAVDTLTLRRLQKYVRSCLTKAKNKMAIESIQGH